MNRIHVLDQTTIDKIAAGEVVERPASVVKELTENAIDAGATRITIEIRDGGSSLIRVSDNGRGIAPEDIPLAFLRHATSKIQDAADLSGLTSLGFRGEALSSIAAVSRVELITKQPEDLAATRYVIEGGREKHTEEIGAPDGTTIIVRDIFYNTPARAKFLKTALTEAAHVGEYVEQLILSNPHIAFNFLVNGHKKLDSSGSGSLRDAVYHIYGSDIVHRLVPVSYEEDGIRIAGMIGKPSISRGNRNFENYYVNGRYIKSRVVSRAIEDGYLTRLMQHQYPFACLTIDIDSSAVDVNVHPTKMEVRFSDEKKVYEAVRKAVKGALDNLEMILSSSMNPPEKPSPEELEAAKKAPKPAEPFERKAAASVSGDQPEIPKMNYKYTGPGKFRREPEDIPILKEAASASESLSGGLLREEGTYAGRQLVRDETAGRKPEGSYVQQTFEPVFLSHEAKPLRRFVGQVFQTYWICEFGNEVFLFDQHAAHERVMYERLMKEYENREITSQQMDPPLIVTLDSREESLVAAYNDAFLALGFEIEHFGERDYALRAVPYYLGGMNTAKLFRDFLDQLEVTPNINDMAVYIKRVATEACKAAVKGGGHVSQTEAEQLLDDLMACEDPYHCPHGRPTIISFTREDLDKRFKRIVS